MQRCPEGHFQRRLRRGNDPEGLHGGSHKSVFKQGASESSECSPAARGLAPGRDCRFPEAALGAPFLPLIFLGVGRKGQVGCAQSGRSTENSTAHYLGPVWTVSRCQIGEHRITSPPTQFPSWLPLVIGLCVPCSLGGNAWQEHLAQLSP